MSKRTDFIRETVRFLFRHPFYGFRWFIVRILPFRRYPDVCHSKEWRSFRESLPVVVRAYFDERWAVDRSSGARIRPLKRSPRYRTDVIYTGMLKADAEKDLMALRKHKPGLHITVLYLWPNLSMARCFVFDIADNVFFIRNQAELVEFLLNADASAVVFQGGDDQIALLNCCLWSGRLVWQVRDTFLRTPKKYLTALIAERSVFIAERVDAIISFHSESGWQELQRGEKICFRSSPISIPPLAVSEIGPRYRLLRLSDGDGELHLIYAGGVGIIGGNIFEKINYMHADFFEKFCAIAKQGIHIHIYSPHTDQKRPGYEEYFQ